MVGVAWAMTPTVGIQMPIVLATWIVARRLFRWDFSLVNGLAWTWLTNVFTLVPCYYVFFVTGQIMLGRFDDLAGYDSFVRLWDSTEKPTLDSWDSIVLWFRTIFEGWGVSMLVGSLPWAVVCGWAGYVWSLAFVRKYRARRRARARQHAGGPLPR